MGFEVLDAFVDGELVDASEVKRALSDPGGRDYLVDAWLLRGVVQDEMAADMAPPAPARAHVSSRRSWAVAAAVAGISLIGGYVVGARLPYALGPAAGTPPAAVAPPSTTPAAAPKPASSSFPMPQPTRVILLEFQTTANPSAGG